MKKEKNKKNNKKEIIFLTAILIFASFIRITSLGTPVFWIDETISTSVAKNILEGGLPKLSSGLDYNGGRFLHYSMALSMLFSQTEFFARLPSVIFGLLTILLVFFIGKEYSKTGGIISALFFSVFYLEVFFSRQARFYQLFQLMFFLSLYLLYKSKENPKFLYLAIIAFFIALDTHLEALVLAPFFILHILYYNKNRWFLSILPLIPLLRKIIPAKNLTTFSPTAAEVGANYIPRYLSYASNMMYILLFFIPGVIWSFLKNKRLTLLILVPSIITLLGVFSLQTFAFRYAYFFIFPLLLFFSLFMSFMLEKHGKIFLIAIIALLIVPSNLVLDYNYVNIISPIEKNFNDPSAPAIDYKAIPEQLKTEMKKDETLLITYFSPPLEFYIREPNFVVPFTMDGRGEDQISINISGEMVDRYSGAKILTEKPSDSYYLAASRFAVTKLKAQQREFFQNLTANCTISYSKPDLVVYFCD